MMDAFAGETDVPESPMHNWTLPKWTNLTSRMPYCRPAASFNPTRWVMEASPMLPVVCCFLSCLEDVRTFMVLHCSNPCSALDWSSWGWCWNCLQSHLDRPWQHENVNDEK